MMHWNKMTAKVSTVVKRRRPKSRDEGEAGLVIQCDYYVARELNWIMLSLPESHKPEDDVQ